MKLATLLLGFILGFSTLPAVAGSGNNHDHGHSHSHSPVSADIARSNATDVVTALVKRSKLDKSWSSVDAASAEKITFEGNPEWMVIFVNENISDVKKQKLYVFLTLGGDYIAANFTGK